MTTTKAKARTKVPGKPLSPLLLLSPMCFHVAAISLSPFALSHFVCLSLPLTDPRCPLSPPSSPVVPRLPEIA
jgi:hypothetical protein